MGREWLLSLVDEKWMTSLVEETSKDETFYCQIVLGPKCLRTEMQDGWSRAVGLAMCIRQDEMKYLKGVIL